MEWGREVAGSLDRSTQHSEDIPQLNHQVYRDPSCHYFRSVGAGLNAVLAFGIPVDGGSI
eukprot:3261953-Ditylum_brightwellii.AAC.1